MTRQQKRRPLWYTLYVIDPDEIPVVAHFDNEKEFDERCEHHGARGGVTLLTSCGETLQMGWEEWINPFGRVYRLEWVFTDDAPTLTKKRMFLERTGGEIEYVYLFKLTGTVWYKIGRSKDPDKRAQNLMPSTVMPFGIHIECTIPTMSAGDLEHSLHNRFSKKRGKGEWFKLDKADVEYVKLLAEMAS